MKLASLAATGVVVLVVAICAGEIASFGFERATVTIAVPQKSVESRYTFRGAPAGGDFATHRMDVALTETMQGTATGVSTTPARYATGLIVFGHWCATLPGGNTCQPTYPVPAGSVLWNNQGTMTFVLLSSVTCFCGESVPVRAWSAGPIGNAAAHTVSLYIRTNGFAYYETADNPGAISGGVDATSSPMVTKADVDAVTATLVAQLATDLKAALQEKAGSLHYQAGTPAIQAVADSSAGARNPTFHVSASGSLSATAFSDTDVQALVASALAKAVPTGWRLVRPAAIDSYDVEFSSGQGDVTVTVAAHGFVSPQIDSRSLPRQLRGLDSRAAVEMIQSFAPGSVVEIRITPLPAPWLPLNGDHIAVVVLPAPGAPPS